MKKFLVTYKESRSITVEVQAETQDQAYDIFHNQRDYQESDWEYWGEETHVEEKSMADVLSAFFENVEQEGE